MAAAEQRGLREYAGRADRQSGDAAGEGGAEGDLPVGLAGRGRRESGGRDVPGSIALSGEFGTGSGSPHQQHVCPRRSDPVDGGQEPERRRLCRLLRTDRRGCRSRLWRRAQRVRADEVNDRSGRGWRALRGSVGVGQEVRSHGRQGTRAYPRRSGQTRSGAAGCGRLRRADGTSGAHRCRGGRSGDLRHRRERCAVSDR